MSETALVMEYVRESGRRWKGTASERTANIVNIASYLTQYEKEWGVPRDMLEDLTQSSDKLQELNAQCTANEASPKERRERGTLLKTLTSYCRKNIRSWACGQHEAGVMTTPDVHQLGFLLPGENGGRRGRHAPTHELANVKAKPINGEFVRIVLDRAIVNNAAQITHGWPYGVRHALIVILSADGSTEVVRQLTSRLHTTIALPKDSQGKAFIAKASFLKHVDDSPLFGNQTVFSMPLTLSDLGKLFEKSKVKEEEMAFLRRENERLRRENEQLRMKE
jgi:hypothetical protein